MNMAIFICTKLLHKKLYLGYNKYWAATRCLKLTCYREGPPQPHTHKTKPVMLYYVYIQNFISKQRNCSNNNRKIHLEIIHNLVTENWENSMLHHCQPTGLSWSRGAVMTVSCHGKALSQGSCSFVPKASATRGNGENLEPKYCHRQGFDWRAWNT